MQCRPKLCVLLFASVWFASVWFAAGCSGASESDAMETSGASDASDASDASSPDMEVTATEPVHVPVAHNAAWILGTAETDPFSLRPEGARCGSDSVAIEEVDTGLWYDILTDECDHATVGQTTLAELQSGDTLLVWVWHYAMDHKGGDFNAQVALGDPPQIVWEITLPVPAQSGLLYEEITLDSSWPTGSPVWFHLSNHGVNTWSLVELARIDGP